MALGQFAITPRSCRAAIGDDWNHGFTLWENGAVKNLTGAAIKVAVQDLTGLAVIPAVTQSSGATGASWSTGVIVVQIPKASTSALLETEYFYEIEATLGGLRETWPLVPVASTWTAIPQP